MLLELGMSFKVYKLIFIIAVFTLIVDAGIIMIGNVSSNYEWFNPETYNYNYQYLIAIIILIAIIFMIIAALVYYAFIFPRIFYK